MLEFLPFLETGGIWACAALLYLTRGELRSLASKLANHERRIRRLETINDKHHRVAAEA
ncbi:hypothetical protein [Asticcacaulis sp.]|uniref:hypothetical protein n=1 Tax=Asticcacaulis sp. TaxID=1872648 RepID=UPI002629A025|nr:hypothetical protein [Asticcacaulis sp.]